MEPLLLPLQTLTEGLRVNHLRRILVPCEGSALSSDQWLLVFDPVLLLDQDQYRDQNSSTQDKCNGCSNGQVDESLLLPGSGKTVGEGLWYENVLVTGDRGEEEGGGGENQQGVIAPRQLDQLVHAVVASEADVDQEAGDVGDGVDADILIVSVGQASQVDLEIVEKIWQSLVHHTGVA